MQRDTEWESERERISRGWNEREREKRREFGVFLTILASWLHTGWELMYLVRKKSIAYTCDAVNCTD